MDDYSVAAGQESDAWASRVSGARRLVQAARTLDELAEVLNSPAFAALPLKDLVTLPTYGGDRPRGRCVFSWDQQRVLTMNEMGDGFTLQPRD